MVGFRKNTSQRLDQLDDVITALNTRVEQLEGERTATAHTLNDILERTNSLDARITATTTELARQLDELGNELSAVADQEPIDVAEIVNGSLVDIRQSQTASLKNKRDIKLRSAPTSQFSSNNFAAKSATLET